MSKTDSPSPLRATEYEAIEAALMESARGRWFLDEYARRNRGVDTQILLDAIGKLESAVTGSGQHKGEDRIRSELIEMSEAISRTRREIAAIKPPQAESQLMTATEELGSIVEATEKATSDVLEAAEEIQETAWQLREKGVDEAACDRLDQRATDIYTACSFQDITGQRTGKVVEVLRFLEKRVHAMVEIWGVESLEIRDDAETDEPPRDKLLNGPRRDHEGLQQNDIDTVMGGPADADEAEEVAFRAETPAPTPLEEAAPSASAAEEAAPSDARATGGEAQQTSTATDRPADGDAGETVSAGDFATPEALELDNLGRAKTDALFS